VTFGIGDRLTVGCIERDRGTGDREPAKENPPRYRRESCDLDFESIQGPFERDWLLSDDVEARHLDREHAARRKDDPEHPVLVGDARIEARSYMRDDRDRGDRLRPGSNHPGHVQGAIFRASCPGVAHLL
jgi:hypothetical protein